MWMSSTCHLCCCACDHSALETWCIYSHEVFTDLHTCEKISASHHFTSLQNHLQEQWPRLISLYVTISLSDRCGEILGQFMKFAGISLSTSTSPAAALQSGWGPDLRSGALQHHDSYLSHLFCSRFAAVFGSLDEFGLLSHRWPHMWLKNSSLAKGLHGWHSDCKLPMPCGYKKPKSSPVFVQSEEKNNKTQTWQKQRHPGW